MSSIPRSASILVVAGRDPTGGAGVDADREAAHAHGVEAELVVTADTDQDGVRVHGVYPRDPKVWLAEARSALARGPRALKSGLLPGADHVAAFAELVREVRGLPLVVDPVLAASGGEVFLDAAGIAVLLEELFALGPIVTPNLGEAARLALLPIEALALPGGRVRAAELLLERGAAAVLVKGGHGAEDPVLDLVFERGRAPRWHAHPRAKRGSLHGSGCRYASAVAAGLASGRSVWDAAETAGRYVGSLVASR